MRRPWREVQDAGVLIRPLLAVLATGAAAQLVDVRAARHEGFDRAVFEFRNH